MGAGSLATTWVLEPEIARQQAERILTSESFRASPIQCRLLRYLIDQTLEGNAGGLKEYTLGAAVFQRGDSFDPRTDSIVRVQVGVLRKKLAAYYEGPGATDPVLIEVPRGHYAPQLTQRVFPEPDPPSHSPAFAVRAWLFLIAGVAIGLTAMWIVDRTRLAPAASAAAAKSTTALEWRDHPVWKGFFEPGVSTKARNGRPVDGRLRRDTGPRHDGQSPGRHRLQPAPA